MTDDAKGKRESRMTTLRLNSAAILSGGGNVKPVLVEALAYADELAARVAELETENEKLDGRRREGRQLLARFVRYEKGCYGPESAERLAKLTASVMDYLGRTAEPRDLLRAEEAGGDER